MSDELVSHLLLYWQRSIFANGLDEKSVRPLADKTINGLRNRGFTDDKIKTFFPLDY